MSNTRTATQSPDKTFQEIEEYEDFNLIIENVPDDQFVTERHKDIEEVEQEEQLLLLSSSSSSSSEWKEEVKELTDVEDEEWSKGIDEAERLNNLRLQKLEFEAKKRNSAYDYENELFGASFFSELSDDLEMEKKDTAFPSSSNNVLQDMGRGESPYARRERSRSVERNSRRRSYSRSPKRYRRSRSPRSRIPRGRYYDGRENPDPCPCLGVFGMSLHTNERDLKKIFGQYGEIETVQIVYDRFSGRSRGFGFVYFRNTRDATKAKDHLKDAVIDGMKVRVDYSVTKGGGPYRHHRSRSRSQSKTRRRSRSPRRKHSPPDDSQRRSRSSTHSRSPSRSKSRGRSDVSQSRSPSR